MDDGNHGASGQSFRPVQRSFLHPTGDFGKGFTAGRADIRRPGFISLTDFSPDIGAGAAFPVAKVLFAETLLDMDFSCIVTAGRKNAVQRFSRTR